MLFGKLFLETETLAQFRSGILPLHIDAGQQQSKRTEERLCLACKLRIIEDEYHFLCECVCVF